MCASIEQFPNKSLFIKTVSVTSSSLQSTIDVFYSAREDMSFIIVHGTVENVMRSRFSIKTANANRI